MKKRKKRKTQVSEESIPSMSYHFHEVPTPELVVLDQLPADFEKVDTSQLKGTFIKVSPILKASEAHLFDGAKVRQELEKAGARAVVLAPRIIADSRKVHSEEEIKSKTVHEITELWFKEQKISEEERAEAVKLALHFMNEEGI